MRIEYARYSNKDTLSVALVKAVGYAEPNRGADARPNADDVGRR
jgi:hypothetical protein